ncbi:unnamed protein product [Haemonchus placei]|uniref:PGM_PMM_I domain-containing protein n=1 Tax=Haemonchus placei TaxID=6290 RepID=A0A0N4W355_HAEPC|nr:unnamed protein product [Haemonchus placei]
MPLSSAAPRSSNEKQEDLSDLDIFGAEALLADIQDPSPIPAPTAEPRLKRTSKKYGSELANASDEQLPTAVRALEVQIAPKASTPNALVVCGMDSRESSPYLTEAVKAGAALMGVAYEGHGLLTTPQLHYIVRCKNDPSFGDAREIGYYARISDAFKKFCKLSVAYRIHILIPTGEKLRISKYCVHPVQAHRIFASMSGFLQKFTNM